MKTKFLVLPLGFIAVFLISAVKAEAGNYGKNYKHDYPHHGHIRHNKHGYKYVKYPEKTVAINIGGIEFYYSDGAFYPKKYKSHYHYRRPAVGTCVSRLPHGYKIVRIGHKKYFKHYDTYHVHTRDGYMVVGHPGQHGHEGVLVSGGARDGYAQNDHRH